ncbi:MAG: hypothetical protein HN443_05800 [Flavobacteriaceae bacterium]|nr:hypothetical protein [Flavobacteriaceae bacterium]MBT6128145.1 hypothetical protein [Flavobacteriaceae bacterium]
MALGLQLTFGQIENNNPSFSFPSDKNNNSSPLFTPPVEESHYLRGDFLKKPLDMTDPSLNDRGPTINMEEQEKFLNPGDIYLSKLKGKGAEAGKDPNKFRTNQYMGDYRIGGNKARIIFRDHEYPDGDRVRILHNDQVIQPNVLLVERFVGLTVELIPGFNKIDFVALNQGSSGPNTAEVRVYDENGEMTAANQWNLATGVKATYILIKE